jgi:hypothetical protein
MPEVVVIPTVAPLSASTWAIIRVVVVFPFVPVIEMTGTLEGAPSG